MIERLEKFLIEGMTFEPVMARDEETNQTRKEFVFPLYKTKREEDVIVHQPLDIRVWIGEYDEELGLRVSLFLHFASPVEPLGKPMIGRFTVFNGFIKDAEDIEVLFEMTGINRVHEAYLRDDYDLNQVFSQTMGIPIYGKTFGDLQNDLKKTIIDDIQEISYQNFKEIYGSVDEITLSRMAQDREVLLEKKDLEELRRIKDLLLEQLYLSMDREDEEEDDFEDGFCGDGCSCHRESYRPLTEEEKVFIRSQHNSEEHLQDQVEFCSKALIELFFSGEPADTLIQAQGYPIFRIIADSDYPNERILEVYRMVCELNGVEMEEQEFYTSYLKEALASVSGIVENGMDEEDEEEEDDVYEESRDDLYLYIKESNDPHRLMVEVLEMLKRPEEIGQDSEITELEELVSNAIDPLAMEESIDEIRSMMMDFKDEVEV